MATIRIKSALIVMGYFIFGFLLETITNKSFSISTFFSFYIPVLICFAITGFVIVKLTKLHPVVVMIINVAIFYLITQLLLDENYLNHILQLDTGVQNALIYGCFIGSAIGLDTLRLKDTISILRSYLSRSVKVYQV